VDESEIDSANETATFGWLFHFSDDSYDHGHPANSVSFRA
jgi:hypothetical protein